VAVKLLRAGYAQDPGSVARFRSEARHAASLSHPGIAQVYDYGEGELPYLVMELVDGPSLARVLGGGPLDPGRAMDVVAQAAAGLDAAHRAGLVHRDIKPANLLLGPGGQVKITDFGISRTAGPEPVTGTGTLLGTPAYLAPERLAGQAATPAGDLYSLGVVAWECLVGGCSAAIAAITDSTTGRRPVTCRNASSPSRGPRSARLGGNSPPRADDPSGSTHVQPASASRPVRSGSSSSQTCRNRGNRLCGWRNWATPLRCQCSHAAAGVGGGLSPSASSTVTWCPSRASMAAADRPITPPPHTTTDPIASPPRIPVPEQAALIQAPPAAVGDQPA